MKLVIYILFGLILTLQHNSADGKLKDIFEHVHDSVAKVRQDVRTLISPNTKNKQEENSDTSTNIHFVDEDVKEDVKPEQPTRKDEVPVVEQPTTTATPTTATPKNGTSEDKDGRENFSAGCLPGYMRTADGRCKPTFG